MSDFFPPIVDAERVAQLIAHRACCGAEHDPANGKLHGYCVVCGVPWPCTYAGMPPAATSAALDASWLPTPENVNALPEPLRRHIAGLETLCDPAGIVRENTILKYCNEGLQRMYRSATRGVRVPANPPGGYQPIPRPGQVAPPPRNPSGVALPEPVATLKVTQTEAGPAYDVWLSNGMWDVTEPGEYPLSIARGVLGTYKDVTAEGGQE